MEADILTGSICPESVKETLPFQSNSLKALTRHEAGAVRLGKQSAKEEFTRMIAGYLLFALYPDRWIHTL